MNSECSICFEIVRSGDTQKPFVTPCGHLFHHKCIKKSLPPRDYGKCPQCNQSVNASELIRLYVNEPDNSLRSKDELIEQMRIQLHELNHKSQLQYDLIRSLNEQIFLDKILRENGINRDSGKPETSESMPQLPRHIVAPAKLNVQNTEPFPVVSWSTGKPLPPVPQGFAFGSPSKTIQNKEQEPFPVVSWSTGKPLPPIPQGFPFGSTSKTIQNKEQEPFPVVSWSTGKPLPPVPQGFTFGLSSETVQNKEQEPFPVVSWSTGKPLPPVPQGFAFGLSSKTVQDKEHEPFPVVSWSTGQPLPPVPQGFAFGSSSQTGLGLNNESLSSSGMLWGRVPETLSKPPFNFGDCESQGACGLSETIENLKQTSPGLPSIQIPTTSAVPIAAFSTTKPTKKLFKFNSVSSTKGQRRNSITPIRQTDEVTSPASPLSNENVQQSYEWPAPVDDARSSMDDARSSMDDARSSMDDARSSVDDEVVQDASVSIPDEIMNNVSDVKKEDTE